MKNVRDTGQAGQNFPPIQETAHGFVSATHSDIQQMTGRLVDVREQLNRLGARLIGPESLPRREREINGQAAAPKDPRPERVLSQSEDVQKALSLQALVIDELFEITQFLEQL